MSKMECESRWGLLRFSFYIMVSGVIGELKHSSFSKCQCSLVGSGTGWIARLYCPVEIKVGKGPDELKWWTRRR